MKTGILMGGAVAAAAVIGWYAQRQPHPAVERAAQETNASARGALFEAGDPATAGDAAALRGRVLEVIDVAAYTYLRLATAQGETWAAVSKAPVAVGSEVTVVDANRMEQFESTTLKRKFDVIYFGNLKADGSGAGSGSLPPGHPAIPAGHPTIGGDANPHAGGAVAASESSPLPHVKVPRAAGANAATIAELFDESSKHVGKLVRVRGQVVKVTPGVLGKTYLRLRDGSATGAEPRELVVTSQAEARVGDVTTFEGTVQTQVDVGIGFVYPVLLADAKALPETPAAPR